MWLMVSEDLVHSRLAPIQEHHDRRAWYSKAAPFVAARKSSLGNP